MKEMLHPSADPNKIVSIIKEEGAFLRTLYWLRILAFEARKNDKINDYVLENIHRLNLFLRMR